MHNTELRAYRSIGTVEQVRAVVELAREAMFELREFRSEHESDKEAISGDLAAALDALDGGAK